MLKFNNNELYVDCEWTLDQKIFLIGINKKKNTYQLYDYYLTKSNFLQTLKNIKYIYFFGPDIKMLEKFFKINLRKKYICINLLKILHDKIKLKSYKLMNIEKEFKIVRKNYIYKANFFRIFKDWKTPKYKKFVLKYNYDDVENLFIIKEKIFSKYKITNEYLKEIRLQ